MLDAVARTIEQLVLLDGEAVESGRNALAERIRHVVADQGTPVEAKLARVLEGLTPEAGIDGAVVDDLKATLAGLVEEARRHLDAGRLSGDTARDLQTVRSRAEALLGGVEMQQLRNAAPPAAGQESYLVFQLPIPGGREPHSAQIRIRQDGEGTQRRIDPRNVSIAFQFELQNLRTVRIGMHVLDRRLTCQIGASDERVARYLEGHAAELRDGLAGLGYQVDRVRCAVLTEAELAAPTPENDRVPSRVMRLDARA